MSITYTAPNVCIAEITRAYISKPYALGTPGQGLDCFSLVYDYLKTRMGDQIPDTFRGLTLDTYGEVFQADPVGAKSIMVDFISEHLQEIPPGMAFAGDILLLQLTGTDTMPFLAIHGGQSQAVAASPEYGVRPWSLSHYTIKRAWRCHRQPR